MNFAIEFTAASALILTHLSRMSEELVLWTSAQFQFVGATGSLLHWLINHAAEEEPGCAGTGARQNGSG